MYRHESFNQTIFYIYGEFDGWLLGPAPDVNFGGIKNSHDRMCVHTQDAIGGWLLSARLEIKIILKNRLIKLQYKFLQFFNLKWVTRISVIPQFA